MIHERRKERKRNSGSNIKELIDEIYSINMNNEDHNSVSIFQAMNNCFFIVRFAILKFKENRSFFIEYSEDDRSVLVEEILDIMENSNYMHFYNQIHEEQESTNEFTQSLLKDHEKVVKHIRSLALP